VHAAIYNPRREKFNLYITETTQRNHPQLTHLLETENSKLSNIVQKANAEKIPIKVLPKQKLDRLGGMNDGKNQNIILQCLPVAYYLVHEPSHLHTSAKTENLTWVMLDRITDPHNFGAILRTAFFMGVDGVFVNIDHRCP
jgi:23S rRNA (guanosine2251-2'-O)-methyltransferase